MRMRTLMLTAVTAGVFHSAAATADVESIVIEEDGQTAPIIEVGGPHRDAYREVLMMYYYDDVTYQDVATTLGVSAATVNARLTKARAMLRERLSGMQR